MWDTLSMARKRVAVRVAEKGATWLEDLATGHGVSLSDVLRACMNVASQHPQELDGQIQAIKEQI
jgi:hypothetical protein